MVDGLYPGQVTIAAGISRVVLPRTLPDPLLLTFFLPSLVMVSELWGREKAVRDIRLRFRTESSTVTSPQHFDQL